MTWATSVPILVFLGLSVLHLGPMYATDSETDVRRASSFNASAVWGGGIIMNAYGGSIRFSSISVFCFSSISSAVLC